MLRLVEAVNLVDKEKCGAGIEEVLPLCLVDDLTNILDARSYGRQGVEWPIEGLGDNLRKGSLTHTRRAPQNKRGHTACGDKLAEYAIIANQMTLADIVVKTLWAESFS